MSKSPKPGEVLAIEIPEEVARFTREARAAAMASGASGAAPVQNVATAAP